MDFIQNLPFSISFIDGLLGGFLVVAALHGFVRGLLKEFLTPVVWLGSLLLAIHFAHDLAPFLGPWIDSSVIRLIIIGVAVGIIFIMAGNLVINLLSNFFHSFGLGSINRLFGLLFGLMGGSVMLIVAMGVLGGWLGEAKWWRDSRVITALEPYEAVVSQVFWQWVEIYKQYLGIAELD